MVAVPHAAELNITRRIAVDVWVNFAAGAGTNIQKIFSKVGPGNDEAYSVRVSDAGRIGLLWNGTWIESNALSWSDGTWYQLQITHNGSSVSFRRNNTAVGSVNNTQTTTTSTGPLYIGRGVAGFERWFNGSIDDLQIAVPSTTALAIRSVSQNVTSLKQFEKVEVTLDIDGGWSNPDNPNEIEVWANITAPDGTAHYVPGFYYQHYQRDDAARTITAVGAPLWKIRYTPRQTGRYSFSVHAKNGSVQRNQSGYTFSVAAPAATANGFLRADGNDKQYHRWGHSQKAFVSLGVNLDVGEFNRNNIEWTPPSRYVAYFADGKGASPGNLWSVYDVYRRSIIKLGQNNANTIRIRLDSWWLPLELGPVIADPMYPNGVPGFAIGRYHPANAWLVDQVMLLAEEHGLAVSVVAWNWNSNWGDSTYAIEQNETLVKRRLRYQVARWGYSTHVLGWELFNELPDTTDPNTDPFWSGVVAWLRAFDPHAHQIFNSRVGIDQRDVHRYVGADQNFILSYNSRTDKPDMLGEFGQSVYIRQPLATDPKGYKAHEAMWATAVTHRSGAWYWWHTGHIDPLDLYDEVFKGVGAFLANEDMDNYTWANARFTQVSGPGGLTYRGMIGNGNRAFVWIVRTPSGEFSDRAAANGNVVDVGGLTANQTYTIQWWNTWTGAIQATSTVTATSDGKVRLVVPDGVTRDIAAKIVL
jgi:hypothetical protein